jgi:hypothetical protein
MPWNKATRYVNYRIMLAMCIYGFNFYLSEIEGTDQVRNILNLHWIPQNR